MPPPGAGVSASAPAPPEVERPPRSPALGGFLRWGRSALGSACHAGVDAGRPAGASQRTDQWLGEPSN
eukprot:10277734-Alexandrium_andersonii.AAC.1